MVRGLYSDLQPKSVNVALNSGGVADDDAVVAVKVLHLAITRQLNPAREIFGGA